MNIFKIKLFGLSPNYRTKCHFLTLILIIIHRTDDFLGSKLFLYYYCINSNIVHLAILLSVVNVMMRKYSTAAADLTLE